MAQPLHIIITGPESAGKSTLASYLAAYLKAPYSNEVARYFLESLNRPYTKADVLTIANLHLTNLQNVQQQGNHIHIFDTGFLVLKIWLQEKYNTKVTWLENALRTPGNDLYILCKPDMPWELDPLRENENDRDRLFDIYEQNLVELGKKYLIVGGSLNERVDEIFDYLDTL